ncbi:MAG: hypothetical protein ABUL62_32575 [Myxococcales bacterium]|jgi:hypothetical protein
MRDFRGTFRRRAACALFAVALCSGCASMYNQQISDIDSTRGRLRPFEIQTNATGVNVHDGATVARAIASDEATRREASFLETVIALTQFGPQTGEPTFSDDWADGMVDQLLRVCPSGQVTGLSARREAMKYPVISGELVTIKGYCIL